MNIKQRIFVVGILLIGFFITSCGSATPKTVTATVIPPTKIIETTNTPQPTAEPTETPELPPALTSWNEIPIFPDAISGKEDFGDYQFTSKSPARIIRVYYEQEMVKLGWEIRTDMVLANSPDFCFSKDNSFVFFLIQAEGDNSIVYIHPVQN